MHLKLYSEETLLDFVHCYIFIAIYSVFSDEIHVNHTVIGIYAYKYLYTQ